MAWESRGSGKKYYYRSRRVSGRVQKEYGGAGQRGEAAATKHRKEQEDKARARQEVEDLQQRLAGPNALADKLTDTVRTLTHAVLSAAGYRQTNYTWRRQRQVPKRKKNTDPVVEDVKQQAKAKSLARIGQLKTLMELSGDVGPEWVSSIKEELDECPEYWQEAGDLNRYVRDEWFDLLCGDDVIQRESMARWTAQWEAELAGPDPQPIELLIAKRYVTLWIQLSCWELELASAMRRRNMEVVKIMQKGVNQCNQQLDQALKSLALVRRALPRTLKIEVDVRGYVEAANTDVADAQDQQRGPAEYLGQEHICQAIQSALSYPCSAD